MNLGNVYKRSWPVLLICAMMLLFALPALAAQPGDCNDDGSVTMTEVQGAINMHLGVTTALSCVDADSSGTVTIAELRNAVNGYLGLPVVVAARPVTGVAWEPIANTAAAGTVVTAYASGSSTPAATVTVQANGSYSITGLNAGVNYQLVFSRTGYGDVSYYGVTPGQSADTALDKVLMLPTDKLSLTTTINGYIKNASDNTGAAMTLRFRPGLGATTGDYFLSKSTDSQGFYSRTTFPAGCYTAEVVKLVDGEATPYGSFTIYSVPGVSTYNNSQSFTVDTGTTPATTYRAVLSWGSAESDLDLHVTGPLNPDDTSTTIGSNNTQRFHVGSTSADPQNSYPYGSAAPGSDPFSPIIPGATTETYLDQDQANHGVDNGNETVTILTQQQGVYPVDPPGYPVYRFYVYNNSGADYLAYSGAKVQIYRGTTLVQSFAVPNKAGNTWYVCDLEGSTITTKNIMSTVTTEQTYNFLKAIPGYPLDELKLFKPVKKSLPAQ